MDRISCIIASVLQVRFTDLCTWQACCSSPSFPLVTGFCFMPDSMHLNMWFCVIPSILLARMWQRWHANRDLRKPDSCFLVGKEIEICACVLSARGQILVQFNGFAQAVPFKFSMHEKPWIFASRRTFNLYFCCWLPIYTLFYSHFTLPLCLSPATVLWALFYWSWVKCVRLSKHESTIWSESKERMQRKNISQNSQEIKPSNLIQEKSLQQLISELKLSHSTVCALFHRRRLSDKRALWEQNQIWIWKSGQEFEMGVHVRAPMRVRVHFVYYSGPVMLHMCPRGREKMSVCTVLVHARVCVGQMFSPWETKTSSCPTSGSRLPFRCKSTEVLLRDHANAVVKHEARWPSWDFPQVISAEEINKHFYFTVQSHSSKIIEGGESRCENIVQT